MLCGEYGMTAFEPYFWEFGWCMMDYCCIDVKVEVYALSSFFFLPFFTLLIAL